jgi:hypothetical protein
MADFPALIPSQAPITPGNWPMASHQSMDGKRGNVRTGSLEIGRAWTPTFENITEADYLTILAHYRAHRLRFDRFNFTVTTLASALTPTGYAWRWAEPPQVVDRHADVFVIRCAFSCVPRPLASMRGGQWRSAASTFTRGAFAGVFGAFETGGQWASAASTFTRGVFSGGLGAFELGGQWSSAQSTFTRGAFSGTSGIFESGARWASAATTFVRGRIAGASVFEDGAQWASEATTFTGGAFDGDYWAPSMLSPLLWLDFADTSTITTSSGSITQIDDKSGNGRHATSSSGSRPTQGTVNGKNCMVTTASQYVQTSTSISAQCFIIVTQFTELTGEQFIVGRANSGGSDYGFHCPIPGDAGYNASDHKLVGLFADAAVRNGSAWQNGVSTAPLSLTRSLNTTCYVFNLTGGVFISQFSADRNNVYRNAGIVGKTCEIIALSSNISSTDRAKLDAYVASKWGAS